MSDVYTWSTKNIKAINKLIDSFYAQKPEREIRPVQRDASTLIRLDGQISSCLSTLNYVMANKSMVSDLKDLVANGDTPESAYFGLTPSLSGPGLGAAIGSAANLGTALLEVFKGARAEKKFAASVASDPSNIKRQMMQNYSTVARHLQFFAQRASENEETAKRYHAAGLNDHILNNAYGIVRTNQWLVFTV